MNTIRQMLQAEIEATEQYAEEPRSWLLPAFTSFAEKVDARPEKTVEIPLVLLEAAADELGNYLEADGGCDHSVGICSCEITGIITALDHLLERHKEKPDPYNCGHCAPDEGELGEEPGS
ncbi:hypothetical protein LCGC14_1839480 [marine sediment metagenome]|uniref:Uncharacterized protein n=1 Tax=marine sediment metagenome TaxID=412755 RepID=A0A0F9GDM9_9ZZZZ